MSGGKRSKTRSVKFDTGAIVNHGELRALTVHISALIAGLEARLVECERVRPVDPSVKAEADALHASVRADFAALERKLELVTDDDPDDGHVLTEQPVTASESIAAAWQEMEAALPEVPLPPGAFDDCGVCGRPFLDHSSLCVSPSLIEVVER